VKETVGPTADEIAGGRVVDIIQHGEDVGAPIAWRADTLHVIGDVLAGDDDSYTLHGVPATGIAGDRRGNLYVLDASLGRVLSYDTAGRHRATFGNGRGEGPGEIMRGRILVVGPGDSIWVFDRQLLRFTGFPPGDGVARTVALPSSSRQLAGSFAVWNGGFLYQPDVPAATAAVLPMDRPVREPVSERLATMMNQDSHAIVALSGVEVDTIWSMPAAPVRADTTTETPAWAGPPRTRVTVHAMRYAPTLRWAQLSDGAIVVADNDRCEFRIVTVDGREVQRVVRDMPPIPYGEADRAAWLKVRQEHADTVTDPFVRSSIRRTIATASFAETVPRISSIHVDGSDRIWVRVRLEGGPPNARIDIYRNDGSFLGWLPDMPLPRAFLAKNRAAYLRADPSTDVQQVVVIRYQLGEN
jgi:hypothetical protein